jgi:hypothetical protein
VISYRDQHAGSDSDTKRIDPSNLSNLTKLPRQTRS